MNAGVRHWDAETQLALVYMQAHGNDPQTWLPEHRTAYECEAAHLRVELLENEVLRLQGLVSSYRALEMGRQSEIERLRKTAPCAAPSPNGQHHCEKTTGHDGCHGQTGDSVVWAWG